MKRWFLTFIGRFMGNCRETTEGCTDLAEGTADPAAAKRMRRHLKVCPACKTYRAQMQTTLATMKATPAEEVTPGERDAALGAFRARRG